MFGQTRGLFFGQTRESAPTTRGDDGDGRGAIKAMEWGYYGDGVALLWCRSGAIKAVEMCLYGGGRVLFKCWGCAFMAVEWCFVGCKRGTLQG